MTLHVFKRGSTVIRVSTIGQFHPSSCQWRWPRKLSDVRIWTTITMRATTSSETSIVSADKIFCTVASSAPIKYPASERSSSYDVKTARNACKSWRFTSVMNAFNLIEHLGDDRV